MLIVYVTSLTSREDADFTERVEDLEAVLFNWERDLKRKNNERNDHEHINLDKIFPGIVSDGHIDCCQGSRRTRNIIG